MTPSRRRRFPWLLLAGLLLLGRPLTLLAADPPAVSFTDIEESLTCQCGCGLTVHSCNHVNCGSALPLRDEIRAQMAEGKDREAILAHFAAKYGEKILSAPTTTGFNLLAWVMPFVLVLVGAALVGLTVLRWRRSSPASGGAEDASVLSGKPAGGSSAYDELVARSGPLADD